MPSPTTSILDNFDRANEGPPPSTDWNTPGSPGDFDGLRVLSSAMTNDAGSFGGLSAWNSSYGPDCEFYFTISNLLSINPAIDFYFRLDAPLFGGATKGYYLDIIESQVSLIRLSDYSTLHTEVVSVSDGDKIWVNATGSLLTVYQDTGAGYVELFNETDSDYTGAGYTAFSLNNVLGNFPAIIIDDFGGGTLGPPPPTPPAADFSGTPLSGPVSLDVDFTDLSTNTPTGWAWDFGDTYTASSQNPSHIYDSIGLFTVALTATNADGSDTETKVDYIEVLGPPVADFSGTPTSGTASLFVSFTDLSTNSPDTWLWDFGDGGSSASQNPTYVYTHVGVYTVTLTASSSAGGDSETKIAYITVTGITEYGAAVIENCDLDTGGASVGLRVSNVAIARDNILGSLTINASAELRMKDNAYSTLVNNGTPNQLAGDRAVFDTATYFDRHASDIVDTTFTYHNDPSSPPMSSYLGNGSIFVGNVSNVATGVTMSGDATINNAGVLTIAAKSVTDAKMALTNGSFYIGGADGAAHEQAISGDASIGNSGALSLTTVNANVGTYGDASNLAQITVDAKGRITAIGEIAFAGGGHTIQDEGTPLAARGNLNFAGAGVTATDDAGNNATLVTIPGGAGIGGSTGATDNAVLRADGAGGATLQNSLATVDDSGTVNIPTGQTYNINNSPHTHANAVARSGATTDGHLAVWNGSSADSIKDGGAVPSPGGGSDFLVVQVFS